MPAVSSVSAGDTAANLHLRWHQGHGEKQVREGESEVCEYICVGGAGCSLGAREARGNFSERQNVSKGL